MGTRFGKGRLPEDTKHYETKVLINTADCPPGTWVVATRGGMNGRAGIVRECIGKYEVRVQFGADGPFSKGKVSSYRLARDDEKIQGIG